MIALGNIFIEIDARLSKSVAQEVTICILPCKVDMDTKIIAVELESLEKHYSNQEYDLLCYLDPTGSTILTILEVEVDNKLFNLIVDKDSDTLMIGRQLHGCLQHRAKA